MSAYEHHRSLSDRSRLCSPHGKQMRSCGMLTLHGVARVMAHPAATGRGEQAQAFALIALANAAKRRRQVRQLRSPCLALVPACRPQMAPSQPSRPPSQPTQPSKRLPARRMWQRWRVIRAVRRPHVLSRPLRPRRMAVAARHAPQSHRIEFGTPWPPLGDGDAAVCGGPRGRRRGGGAAGLRCGGTRNTCVATMLTQIPRPPAHTRAPSRPRDRHMPTRVGRRDI